MRKQVLLEALAASKKAINKTKDLALEEKMSPGDILTKADIASEKAAEAVIKWYGDDNFISEERPDSHEKIHDPSWSGWVIDPIDGTNNFARGIPYWSISLAFIERGIPILGAILDPIHDELYIAEKDLGATKNGKIISVGDRSEFDQGTRVCSSVSYEPGLTVENILRYEKIPNAWVDFLSSAALDFSYVASGRIDLFHHNGLKPWDNAAGVLIAEEAGAVARRFNGDNANWRDAEMVIGNPCLVDQFLKLIKRN